MVFNFWKKRRAKASAPKLRSRDDARKGSEEIESLLEPSVESVFAWTLAQQFAALSGLNVCGSKDTTVTDTLRLALSQKARFKHLESLKKVAAANELDADSLIVSKGESFIRVHQLATSGTTYEAIIGAYLIAGLLDDFLEMVIAELPAKQQANFGELPFNYRLDALHDILADAISRDAKTADRLALWGRRFVGEVILVIREVLAEITITKQFEAAVAPIIASLLTNHTRRMFELGLTA